MLAAPAYAAAATAPGCAVAHAILAACMTPGRVFATPGGGPEAFLSDLLYCRALADSVEEFAATAGLPPASVATLCCFMGVPAVVTPAEAPEAVAAAVRTTVAASMASWPPATALAVLADAAMMVRAARRVRDRINQEHAVFVVQRAEVLRTFTSGADAATPGCEAATPGCDGGDARLRRWAAACRRADVQMMECDLAAAMRVSCPMRWNCLA